MIQPELKNKKKRKINGEKLVTWFIFIIIAFAVLALLFTAKSVFFNGMVVNIDEVSSDHFGAGGFTEYDLQLAREIMDKDGDGKCDVCGMDIDFCIESGQLQCNMGGKTDKLNIGVLDKTKQKHHYHADISVYLEGEKVNLAQEKYFVKSRFIHVENDVQEEAGKVLYMHATGVPLWLFFDSIGLDLPSDMKAYVNGKEIFDYRDYVFNDLDKILITGGKGDLQEQLNSVTSFSQNH